MQLNLASGESLQAVMSGAAGTTNPHVRVDYLQDGVLQTAWTQLNGATAVTLLSGKNGSVRVVTGIYCYNIDSAAVTITITHVGAATYTITKQTLQVADTLVGDKVVDTNGQTKTSTVSSSVDLADDANMVFGTDDDVYFVFSTADASNPTFVMALDNTSQQLHVTDKGAVATDWNLAAVTHPTVYLHSNTTPATDYLEIGGHDGTTAHVNVQGGTTLELQVGGTAEVLMTASILDLASTDLQMQASGQILDNNGNELIEFLETASAVNGLRIVNAATGNNPIITNEGEADTGITIAGYDGTNTEEICEFDAVATAVNGWKMAPAASGSIPRFGSNGTGAAADTGFELVDSNGNEVIEAVATASAVNGIRVVNSATGVMPIITNEGEADTGLVIAGYDGTNTEQIVIFDAIASAVNEFTIKSAAAGGTPEISTTGDDTDINLKLTPKGAGFIHINGPQQVRSSTAVTATTGGGTTGLIPAGASLVVVTSDDVNKQISLPAATVGDRIRILVGATGCELISAVATHKVNNVVVGATNEAALTANNMYDCQYLATDTWVVIGYTNLGAVQAALVPDAL